MIYFTFETLFPIRNPRTHFASLKHNSRAQPPLYDSKHIGIGFSYRSFSEKKEHSAIHGIHNCQEEPASAVIKLMIINQINDKYPLHPELIFKSAFFPKIYIHTKNSKKTALLDIFFYHSGTLSEMKNHFMLFLRQLWYIVLLLMQWMCKTFIVKCFLPVCAAISFVVLVNCLLIISGISFIAYKIALWRLSRANIFQTPLLIHPNHSLWITPNDNLGLDKNKHYKFI